jgi:uncharacterized protein (DUF1800 family)
MSSDAQALIATRRFGLGARPGDLAQVARDPRGWLSEQIAADVVLPDIRPSAARVFELTEARRERRAAQQADGKAPDPLARVEVQQREIYLQDNAIRLHAAVSSGAPFAERWVRFWSNHFTVSIARPMISGLVVPFENEAIRPHAFGRFAEMTLAAVRHPAMLLYLDNARSIGPNSRFGRRKQAGLNENLARELMELHTLGVDGGYAQDDVRALAKILTGWTIARPSGTRRSNGVPGSFLFAAIAHEPGDKLLLGRRYAENGEQEGVAAIRDLCAHPATAHHVAFKVARHFLADDPPPSAVAALAAEFAGTGGDLAAVARRLIRLPESWSLPMTKVRPPEEWLIAIHRAFGLEGDAQAKGMLGVLKQLGQIPFAAPSPAGWPDDVSGWLGPEAVMARLDLASAVARRMRVAQPQAMAERILGPAAGEESRLQVARAPSAAEAVALLLVSPEFMLR